MIRQIYSKREKRHVWMIDVTIAWQRIRLSGYRTKKEADEAVAWLRMRYRALAGAAQGPSGLASSSKPSRAEFGDRKVESPHPGCD
jgi:hypothetical protein